MGIGGIGIWQLLIILVVVLLLFGTKRLKGLGGDLGGAIKGFKKAMTEEKGPEGEQEPEKVEANQDETDSELNKTAQEETSENKSKS